MMALFVVAGSPVAAVVLLVVGLPAAVGYLVVQTAFLTYGLRRRQVARLRLRPDGLSFEPGRFQLKARWEDVQGVTVAELPDGRVEALELVAGRLHWVAEPSLRHDLAAKGWDRLVPVGSFDPAWRDGPIGDALHRWCPAVELN